MKKRDDLERLRNMGTEDLQNEVGRLKESLFRLNFKLALGEVDSVKRIREDKKSLARINTLITQRFTAERNNVGSSNA